MELTNIIPALRKRAGLSAEEARRKLGLTQSVYRKYDPGDSEIPLGALYRMAVCFDVSVDVLLAVGSPRVQIQVGYHAGKGVTIQCHGLDDEDEDDKDKDGKENKDDKEDEEDEEEKKEVKKEVKKEAEEMEGEVANGKNEKGGKKDLPNRKWKRGQKHEPEIPLLEKKILDWQRIYATGVECFDKPNKNFISVMNQLYTAGLGGWDYSRKPFEEAIRHMVQYAQVDMRNEEVLMERTAYPGYKAHKREHLAFLKEIHRQGERYIKGQEINVKNFVMYLRDWVQSHIGISDRSFALYLVRLKREGALAQLIVRIKKTADNRIIIK